MASEPEIAYMAGFFDGEGCIYISKTTFNNKVQFQLRVTCSQVDPLPLTVFVKYYGASVYKEKRKRGLHHRQIHSWEVRGRTARQALEDFLPFLLVKKRQAEFAIKFQERMNGRIRLTEEEQDIRNDYYVGLKALKARI